MRKPYKYGSSYIVLLVDCGILGNQELTVYYDWETGSPGGFDEPPTHPDLSVTSVTLYGSEVNLCDSALDEITEYVKEEVNWL